MSGPNYEERDDGLYVCHGDHQRSEPCNFVKVEPMPDDLPDCPGCTDPRSEGTHCEGTKQHPKYVPWTEAGGPNECEHGYAAGISCPHCDAAKKPLGIPISEDEKVNQILTIPQPPAPAMRVGEERGGGIAWFLDSAANRIRADVADLLADRADLLRENARLRGELAHVRAMGSGKV